MGVTNYLLTGMILQAWIQGSAALNARKGYNLGATCIFSGGTWIHRDLSLTWFSRRISEPSTVWVSIFSVQVSLITGTHVTPGVLVQVTRGFLLWRILDVGSNMFFWLQDDHIKLSTFYWLVGQVTFCESNFCKQQRQKLQYFFRD